MKDINVTHITFELLSDLGYTDRDVPLSSSLEDLGIDSIEVVELAAGICRRLGLPASVAPDVRNVQTLADLVARIERLIGEVDGLSAGELS